MIMVVMSCYLIKAIANLQDRRQWPFVFKGINNTLYQALQRIKRRYLNVILVLLNQVQMTMDAELQSFLLQSAVRQKSIDKLINDEVRFEALSGITTC